MTSLTELHMMDVATLEAHFSAQAAGKSIPERAKLGMELQAILDARFTKAQQEKTAWIATARANFQPGAREACCICGKYLAVTQAHHIVPLSRQDMSKKPDQRFVWLCPTHHAGVHQMINATHPPKWEGFELVERQQMLEIAQWSVQDD